MSPVWKEGGEGEREKGREGVGRGEERKERRERRRKQWKEDVKGELKEGKNRYTSSIL